MEWHPVFRAGRSRLQVSFTGGHMCGGASTPASFETADPVVQAVIESSDAFRSGRIRIGMEMDSPGGQMTVKEFKDTLEAADFLHYHKGVPLEKVITPDQCLAQAQLVGIDLRITGKEKHEV